MSIKLNPYLNFDGNTHEAMTFYQSVLGGELKVMKFSDLPGMPVPPGYEQKVMHAQLETPELTLMASEGAPGQPLTAGDNISIMLSGEDKARLSTWFQKLSVGGQVLMPLGPQSWGDEFGLLKDKFGIQWMVNIAAKR